MDFQRRQWDASEITASSGPRQACQDRAFPLETPKWRPYSGPTSHDWQWHDVSGCTLWTSLNHLICFFQFVIQNFWRTNAKLSFFWMFLHFGFRCFLHSSIFDASEVSESVVLKKNLHGLKQTCVGIEARRKKDCVLCAMEFADCCLANSRHKTTVLFWGW